MPEESKPAVEQPVEPAAPAASDNGAENEAEAGDFITRNVLDKDSVFFEG